MKLLFAPVSIVSGLIAGLLGRKVFARVWAVVDNEEPPKPEHRWISWPKLLGALALEGAVFRLVKGAVDHASRGGFAKLTGKWPGEEAPEPEQK
jgi:Protein of unknown function (DUF4235)